MRAVGTGTRGCVGPLHGSRSWSLRDAATSTARGQAWCRWLSHLAGDIPTKGTPKPGGVTQCWPQVRARRGFSISNAL